MKKLNGIFLGVLVVLVAFLSANTEAFGDDPSADGPLATINLASNEIILYPHAGLNVERFILKVSGPADFFDQHSFDAGITPYFRLTGACVDGSYTYELLGIPALSPEDRESLAEARKSGDDSLIADLLYSGRWPRDRLVQSGYFSVLEGRIAAGKVLEDGGAANGESPPGTVEPKTVFYNEDLITTGSFCVGFDCVNGESFGYDTIKLKENNLQIFFDDTSATASFPANDWRLIANDSTNGGANYFAIQDATNAKRIFSVMANAPSNSLYIDQGGRVGLKTATPAVELHISDGDTPTVRLDQNGSFGFAPQIWDMAGNEANFFIRDVTNFSQLPFRIKPGAKTDTLTVQLDGRVGIGTWAPQKELHVVGDALIEGSLELSSSRELKENIYALSSDEALAALRDLRPVKYNYKTNKSETVVGFVAEEVPDLVATNSRKTLNPMDIVAMLTKVVQEQQKTIAELNRRLDALEHQNLEIMY